MKLLRVGLIAAFCCGVPPAFADYSFKLNGFFTAGYAVSDAAERYAGYIDKKGTFQADTTLGLQGAFKVDEDVSVVVQAVGSGQNDNYDFVIDWAYVNYDVTPDLKVRVGRIRRPLYMLSDYLNVSYAYPWIRPPVEVYSMTAMPNTSGIDILYKTSFAGLDWVAQPYVGGEKAAGSDVGSSDFTLRKSVGLNLTVSANDITFRLGGSHSKMDNIPNQSSFITSNTTSVNQVTFRDKAASFWGAGLTVEKDFVFMGEYTTLRSDTPLVPGKNAWYAMTGYHFGKFMPHVTYSIQEADRGKASQSSNLVGMRYEMNKSTALKVEFQQVRLKGTTFGTFISATSNGPARPLDNNVNIFSIAVSTTF